jgi:cytochrome P450
VATTVEDVFTAPLTDATTTIAAGGQVDLADLARDLTGRMTCHLLGITPPAGTARATALRVSRLAERLTSLVPLSDRPLSPRRLRAFQQPLEELTETARQSYDNPDLPPTAIVRRLREAGLDFAETRGVLASLFIVGTQTVAVALPRIVALLVDTGQWGRLRQHPELLPGAIDEGLRCTAPTLATIRAVARPVTLAGHRLAPGDRLTLLTHNCAKNPRLFPAPWRYDPARIHPPEARHLWFGAGPHFCLGFALAQEELRSALRALTALPNDLTIVGRRPSFGFLPRYERLVVRAGRSQ